jgi:hypothetical protein
MRQFLPASIATLALVLVSQGCSFQSKGTGMSDQPIAIVDSVLTSSVYDEKPTLSDREVILNAVLHDILTNPELETTRNCRGIPGGKVIALSTASSEPWPTAYVPDVDGFEFWFIDPNRDREPSMPPQLCICLNHFAFPPPDKAPKDDMYGGCAIHVGIFNVGGITSKTVKNGCGVFYSVEKLENKWLVTFEGQLAP